MRKMCRGKDGPARRQKIRCIRVILAPAGDTAENMSCLSEKTSSIPQQRVNRLDSLPEALFPTPRQDPVLCLPLVQPVPAFRKEPPPSVRVIALALLVSYAFVKAHAGLPCVNDIYFRQTLL